MRRAAYHLVALVAGLTLLAGCGGAVGLHSRRQGGSLKVLYAAALARAFQENVAPAYEKATGFSFEGDPGGSQALAHEITGRLQRVDVFVSASPKVTETLMGKRNGDWVRWYVTFASSPIVLAYSPLSRYAGDFHSESWTKVVTSKGFILGRTDPSLDPSGAMVVKLLKAADSYYKTPGLSDRVLAASDVEPEQDELGRLETGQVDASFIYKNLAVETGMPYVSLPTSLGGKAVFTISIVRGAPDPPAALAFVHFLLSKEGTRMLRKDGLTLLPHRASGSLRDVPSAIRSQLDR